jgi:hypothetical protein
MFPGSGQQQLPPTGRRDCDAMDKYDKCLKCLGDLKTYILTEQSKVKDVPHWQTYFDRDKKFLDESHGKVISKNTEMLLAMFNDIGALSHYFGLYVADKNIREKLTDALYACVQELYLEMRSKKES